jgi:hypothetical protein
MKKILASIVLLFLLSCMKGSFGDCHKDKDPNATAPKFKEDIATLTATDYTACICCGGIFIDINNTQYRLVKWPTSFDISGRSFPIKVKLTWKVQNEACASYKGALIEASEIQILQ